jgi:hypothetical protein
MIAASVVHKRLHRRVRIGAREIHTNMGDFHWCSQKIQAQKAVPRPEAVRRHGQQVAADRMLSS